MISYHNGDLLESKCNVICHQVNLQGIMGGGLALQIATKYPECEKEYKLFNSCYCGGCVDFYQIPKTNDYIANCYSQELNFDTNYEWVKSCFEMVLNFAKPSNNEIVTIGVPYNYGCGIANGKWNKVEQIFKELFENEKNIDFQIWKLGGNNDNK